ncbi:MAG: class I SAM-dependent methyltransferase, partial [Planctomycetales bacterium]
NRRAWDSMARKNQRHTKAARDEQFHDPLSQLDRRGWLGGSVQGQRLLCLAAGGGRQSALYAQAGAIVTVVDVSPAMLDKDRQVARERNLAVTAIEGSMDDLSMLPDASFDVVIHPVSTCYVPDVRPVYRETARVTVAGGIYISQHKQPSSMQADARPSPGGYELSEPYYRQGPLPAVEDSLHREPGTLEFLHRWEELIGEMCQAGFVIEALSEPYHGGEDAPSAGSFSHRSRYVAPYVRLKARRVGDPESKQPQVWTP